LQFFAARRARVAITTHYTPVKLFALESPDCVVAAVDVDVDTLTPRYRLTYDSIGRSLALPIARQLGLPAPILAAAEAAQPEQARILGAALERLERTRARLDAELDAARTRAAAAAERETESQRLAAELRERRRTAWAAELREARAFVRTLKDEGRARLAALRAAGDRAAFERFTHEQTAAIAAHEAPEPVADAPPAAARSTAAARIGETVEVGERGIRGELLAVEGTRAWIQRGSMRFEVPASQLRPLGHTAPAAASVTVAYAAPDTDSQRELSLIGLRAREAVGRLERFLDRAVQSGLESVRIVHGVGSGALRRAIHDYLATSPYCAGFRAGESNEGGAGVTVATLHA
jgi:DNA mismatch repair protein MutS2